ncbi:sorting nexin-14 [Dermacentor silvarum]|uniref:sorting nexin-14 n=1 Tax=Dermacentor silvarum TaxID=543639 RepID=UPI001898F5DA|nr:sorting nexin-14 [Dermacentor silvarum]
MHSYSVIVCHDKLLSSAVVVVLGVAAACVLWLGVLSGVTVICSFICGCVWMRLLKHGHFEVPDLFVTRKRTEKKGPRRRFCDSAGGAADEYALFPWKDLKVPKEVDQALQSFLNGILREYVHIWFRDVSGDQAFVHELRLVLRHLLAALCRRAADVDLVRFITGPVAQAAISHLDAILRSRVVLSDAADQGRLVLSSMGSQVHVAVGSREAEHQYLRLLSESLVLRLLPARYVKCKSACTLLRELIGNTVLLKAMDVIADPDIVNHLLLLFLDKAPMTILPLDCQRVEFLENFVRAPPSPSHGVHHSHDLQSVLGDPATQFSFLEFLQDQGARHLYDFYSALDNFHLRILNPELSPDDRLELHDQANEIYIEYMAEDTPKRVPLAPGTAEKIHTILERGPDEIVELQKSPLLYAASDGVYSLLEEVFCPLFFESDKYFELICKVRAIAQMQKGQDRNPGKSWSVAKLGHKLKDAFWATADDGLEEDAPQEAIQCAEEPQVPEVPLITNDSRLKDLTAWRVSIPRTETRIDMQHRHYVAFVVEVQRIDVGNGDSPEDLHWSVVRRHHEFYVLEAKLLEFHGELAVTPLPPRRSPARQQLQACRTVLEKYLQDLLTLPPLRSSELLYSFLRLDVEFTASFLPDIRLGKMFRTVPMRLLKEKGQHLEPFLQTFLASTQQAPPRPRPDLLDAPRRHVRPQRAPLLQKNRQGPPRSSSQLCAQSNTMEFVYDYGVHLADVLFHAAPWLLRLLRALVPLLRCSVQGVTERYLEGKLKQALAPGRLTLIINLLSEAVLREDEPPRTQAQKCARATETRLGMEQFLPDILVRMIGPRYHALAVETVFQAIQQPLLNKQISYVLLDLLVEEMFPEMKGWAA